MIGLAPQAVNQSTIFATQNFVAYEFAVKAAR